MSGNATWGFGIGDVQPKEGFEDPPVGNYTFEIESLHKDGVCLDKNQKKYIMPKMNIVDTDVDEKWIGRTYAQYMSLDEENDRVNYTINDLLKMGVPKEVLTDDGDPNDMIGVTFRADLVERNGFRNLRNIEALGYAGSEDGEGEEEGEPDPEPKKTKTAPKRRGSARGGSRR